MVVAAALDSVVRGTGRQCGRRPRVTPLRDDTGEGKSFYSDLFSLRAINLMYFHGPPIPSKSRRLPRDFRGSLEVFNPDAPISICRPKREPTSPFLLSFAADDDEVQEEDKDVVVGHASQRAAEWGLILQTDRHTGWPQGVTARPSGSGHTSESGNSLDETAIDKARVLPRVSEELHAALFAFQQTFVVSDATRPDHPILYASARFFNMTGYSSNEVVGRNCRFLQSSETDPAEIAKISFLGMGHGIVEKNMLKPREDLLIDSDDERPESFDDDFRRKEMRRGMDLATTLECIEKNFVITEPRLPDNPIIFASDSFLRLTEYSREEILGRNCRFLQGPETDRGTVKKIRDAIDNQIEVTVQLINYTKSGKKIWNLFHLQSMRDQKGDVQYFIGVQLDGTERVRDAAAKDGAMLVKKTADNIDEAAKELPDANLSSEDLWANHSKPILPKPHMKGTASWRAIQKVPENGESIDLKHFKPVKPLGSGDTGRHVAPVNLVLVIVGNKKHCLIYYFMIVAGFMLQKWSQRLNTCIAKVFLPEDNDKKKGRSKSRGYPIFFVEPMRALNSFAGTEEYIAPEIITGAGHTSAVDWWALGILLYEMLYGYTPFRGKTRQRTFANILHKDIRFPTSIEVSLAARQLMYRLLHRDPTNRLGSYEGASEIKQHVLFRDINWALVRTAAPPKLGVEETIVTVGHTDIF
ncbi:Phototropin-1 [Panicum miliaceum]|uniref:Phototropin-1 n=1 Tax=Panicum miliaceum TaxID=4540 RepID=A0A3L6QSP2_PANMI|nr:Phototropin-1 [Panicum miliaceum]